MRSRARQRTVAQDHADHRPPAPEVPIFEDPTRLHQLLGNLLSNAIKFSPNGDAVHVIVDNWDSPPGSRSSTKGQASPRVKRDQLAERFEQLASSSRDGRARDGTGPGHRQVGLAEAPDGLVDIVDTPGWSTTFEVFLPMRTSVASVAWARSRAS